MRRILLLSLIFSIVSFLLHLLWEYLQCIPFFYHEKLLPTHQGMLIATLGDVVLTYIAYLCVAAIKKDWLWPLGVWDFKIYSTQTILALILSIFIELRALSTGRWSYLQTARLQSGGQSRLATYFGSVRLHTD